MDASKKKEMILEEWNNRWYSTRREKDSKSDNIKPLTNLVGLERLEICKDCEHFTGKVCLRCQCLLAGKLLQKDAKCPIDKW